MNWVTIADETVALDVPGGVIVVVYCRTDQAQSQCFVPGARTRMEPDGRASLQPIGEQPIGKCVQCGLDAPAGDHQTCVSNSLREQFTLPYCCPVLPGHPLYRRGSTKR